MFTLEKAFTFEAAHRLPNHRGKCQRLHGHSWKGVLMVEELVLQSSGPSTGMVTDFYNLSEVMNPILEDYLDHHHLNDTLELLNPTSEEIARWLFHKVRLNLPNLVAVRIEETCTSSCTYRP